ncbi:MAG TPA: hypothetical protein DCY74_10545, partial [Clostridiales bacterium]|nr:hypothetical protein [Clostridiales bacterium]
MITIHCDNNAHRLDAYHLLCILFDKSREITATLSFAIQGDRVNCSGVLQLEDTTLPLQATTLISRHKSQKRAENAAMGKAILEGCNRKLPYGYSVGVRPVKVPLSYIKSGVSPDEITEFLQTDYGMAKRNAEILSALALEELTWEQTLTEKDICFYLSIPFYPTRCSYCSFISSAAPNHLKILPYYVELLCKEIALLGKALQENGYNIRAMYMGGGTPSVLTAKQLEQIFTRLYNYPIFFNIGEITVECGRPDTVDEEKLNILKAFHVDRICINPQTTQDEVLNAIGRCHTTSRFYHAFELARKAGFSTLNCDLIAGLPGDTRAGFEQSITDVLALQPENVTIHTFSAKKSAYLTTTGQTNPTKADTDWVDF